MSDQELKPCPLCGGLCHTVVGNQVSCSKCEYWINGIDDDDEAGAIRLHNSIPRAEKCRWKYLQRGVFSRSCGDTYRYVDCFIKPTITHKYCDNCAKEIEEEQSE